VLNDVGAFGDTRHRYGFRDGLRRERVVAAGDYSRFGSALDVNRVCLNPLRGFSDRLVYLNWLYGFSDGLFRLSTLNDAFPRVRRCCVGSLHSVLSG
jgi:hypothetical protein